VKTRVNDKVIAVKNPRQKTRVQGSVFINEIRRASGLRITMADTMRSVPLAFSLKGAIAFQTRTAPALPLHRIQDMGCFKTG
jgi:hypothetical protein